MTTPTTAPAVPAGWYPDPTAPDRQRWWDGRGWTDHTHPPALPAPPSSPPPPMAPSPAVDPPKRFRWWIVGLGAAALVAVIVAVAAGVLLSRTDRYPSEWDPRVADIVAFDQQERGLDYKHPVEIEFVPEETFAQSVRVDETQLDEEDLADIESSEAQLRALGLIDGTVDLVDSQNDIQSAGTLAYYSPEEEKVYVRGTELTPAVRSTLAHELTHVLQDQHFDLREMEASSPDPGAVRSIVEGDANRIQYAYVDQLPQADQDAIGEEEQSGYEDSGLDTMPDALVAATSAPYALGQPAVAVLAARGGNTEVNQAFFKPPTADVQILDPSRLTEGAPDPVDLPELPDGATTLTSGDPYGALFWDVILARRVGLHPALAFADSWDGDTTVTYETTDGRTCVAAAVRATDAAAAASMLTTLQAWLAAGTQPLDDATFARMGPSGTGDVVELGVCDPGTDAAASGEDNAQAAIALAAIRLQFEAEALKAGQTMPAARCFGNGGIAPLEAADLAPDADPVAAQTKAFAALQAAATICGVTPR